MSLTLAVRDIRMVPGCSDGLDEPTAVLDIDCSGTAAGDPVAGIRFGLSQIFVKQPFFGVGESDWPAAFLVQRCGEGPQRVLGEWLVAVIIALQRLSRDPVWAGRVLGADDGRLRLAVPWRRASTLHRAVDLALELIGQWTADEPDAAFLRSAVEDLIGGLRATQTGGLDEDAFRYVQAAAQRGIPFEILPGAVQLGWGSAADLMNQSRSRGTTAIAAHAANNKMLCAQILTSAGLPVSPGAVVTDLASAEREAAELGWPVVVKPLALNQGRGVVVDIRDIETLRRSFDAAERLSPGYVIVEKHIDGHDHRLLLVRGRFLAAARRIPPEVTGDGRASIRTLIDRCNAEPWRQSAVYSMLESIVVDEETSRFLAEQNLTLDSVPEPGRRIVLRRAANVSTGASAEAVTAVDPQTVALAERAARLIGLDIAAVDVLTTDITRPLTETGGVICEVNAQPGLGVQWLAEPDRDISGEVIDILFAGRSGRIPVAALSGSRAAGAAALVLHRLWMTAGMTAAVCTPDVLLIGEEPVGTGDLTGQPGGRIMLTDPAVDVAIMELPAARVNEFGHPCDRYGVAAIAAAEIEFAAEQADIVRRASDAVVVNADDPACLALAAAANSARLILISTEPAAPVLAEHRAGGGAAVFAAEHDGAMWIVLATGSDEIPLGPVRRSSGADTGPMLVATAAAWAQGMDPATIRRALT